MQPGHVPVFQLTSMEQSQIRSKIMNEMKKVKKVKKVKKGRLTKIKYKN